MTSKGLPFDGCDEDLFTSGSELEPELEDSGFRDISEFFQYDEITRTSTYEFIFQSQNFQPNDYFQIIVFFF